MSDYQQADAEEYRQQQAFFRQHAGEIHYAFTVYLERFKEQRTTEDAVAFVPHGWVLYAEKAWIARDPADGEFYEGRTALKLAEGGQAELEGLKETERELNALLDRGDVALAMGRAEQLAIQNGFLDPRRADPRLFTEGPDDPFATRREAEQDQAQDAYAQFKAGCAAADAEDEKPNPGLEFDL
jgi:hypothetical protein